MGAILPGFPLVHGQRRADNELAATAAALSGASFSAVWLPVLCKSSEGAADVGYSVYDLFDLGELDQKGSTPDRTGDPSHPGVMAVVLSNGSAGNKWMNTFRPGAVFRAATGHIAGTVTADANGWGNFTCPAGSVSVWLS